MSCCSLTHPMHHPCQHSSRYHLSPQSMQLQIWMLTSKWKLCWKTPSSAIQPQTLRIDNLEKTHELKSASSFHLDKGNSETYLYSFCCSWKSKAVSASVHNQMVPDLFMSPLGCGCECWENQKSWKKWMRHKNCKNDDFFMEIPYEGERFGDQNQLWRALRQKLRVVIYTFGHDWGTLSGVKMRQSHSKRDLPASDFRGRSKFEIEPRSKSESFFFVGCLLFWFHYFSFWLQLQLQLEFYWSLRRSANEHDNPVLSGLTFNSVATPLWMTME